MEGDMFCTQCGARIDDYKADSGAETPPSGSAGQNTSQNTYQTQQGFGGYNQSIPNDQYQGSYTARGYTPNPGSWQGYSQPGSNQYNYAQPSWQMYNQQGYSRQPEYNEPYYVPELSLFDYFKKCLTHYADFSGRARRKEYWGYSLFLTLFYIGGGIICAIIDLILELPIFTVLLYISTLAFVVPSIAATVRRLHDIGKSGAWYFISFVPFIGGIWLFVLTLLEGEPRANMYGPPTKNFPYYR